MLEIKVTVNLLGLPDAINNLANALSGVKENAESTQEKAVMTVAPVVAEETPAVKKEKAEATPEEKPVEQPAAAPAKKYTFKTSSRAGAALCTSGKTEQLVSLLNSKYGVAAITMLDESRYGELAEDLIALGATIEED